MEAFDDFIDNANVCNLTRLDIEAMKTYLAVKNNIHPDSFDESQIKAQAYKVFGYEEGKKEPSEMTEFKQKMKKLNVF